MEGSVGQDQAENLKSFKAAMKDNALKDVTPETAVIEIECKIGAGSDYIEIKDVVDVKTNEKVNLTHKAGQVLLIDFWATWCPPCQKPMAHNQEMLEHKGEAWGDKVRVIGISIDKDVETVANHVKKNKWESVEHFYRAGSSCSEDYSVNGVPHVMLVDTEGKLAFVGHPAVRKLEEDIDTLIKGEKLTGEGTAGTSESEDRESGDQEYKDLDMEKISKDFEKFIEGVKALDADDEVKTNSEQLMRAITVLISQSKYNAETDKFVTKYQNVNVLVGPKASVDLLKTKMDELNASVGGEYEKVDGIQAF